jgi:hypothetical protein
MHFKRICYFQFDRDLIVKENNVLERVLDTYILNFFCITEQIRLVFIERILNI